MFRLIGNDYGSLGQRFSQISQLLSIVATMENMELIEKIAIKNLTGNHLVSMYPKVFDMNVESDLNFYILAQKINRNQKQDLAMSVCMANGTIDKMAMMSSAQRQVLNNLFPTSLQNIENKAISEKVEEGEGVKIQPCATNERVGQEKVAERKLSRTQRTHKLVANTKKCVTRQAIEVKAAATILDINNAFIQIAKAR